MGQKIQAVKGMNDLLPQAQKEFKLSAPYWQAFENIVNEWTHSYGYSQIRTPIVEQTGLFVRSIGEETDVVGKEMYTFSDSNDKLSLSLRPEGTASCLRAVVEHNLLYNNPQKLWYMGPMFRRERPQKGRYRQFHQVGVEALGFDGPDIDAEIIAMSANLWQRLGIQQYLTLEINSLGNKEERQNHKEALVKYLQQHEALLDEDSRRRMHTNPLRVLDTKNPDLQELANHAPRLIDYLGEHSLAHFDGLKKLLDGLGINYIINPRLVRGLDYYNLTVFEWVTDKLGSQATVCGGGRYNGLIEELGGKATAAIGFALGVERLLLLVQEYGQLETQQVPDIYCIHQGEGSTLAVMQVATILRQNGLSVYMHCGDQSLKAQMKKADASGARFAMIVGEDEVDSNTITIKDLQQRQQQTVSVESVVALIQQWKNL